MVKVTLKPGTMLNPVPAVMVSCGSGETSNIITVAWTGIVNSEPPMTYISVRKSRYSHQLISMQKEFVINLTTEALAKATDYCGVRSGKDVNKADVTGLTFEPAEKVSCPMIAQSPVNLECRVCEIREYGSHDMFVAEIVAVHVDEELFDERGRICLDKAGLLAYSHGEYFGLKRHPLGRFGYSVMKAKTRKRLNREKAAGRKGRHYQKKKRNKRD